MSEEPQDFSTEPEPEAAPGRGTPARTELGFVVLASSGAPELTGAWLAVGASDQEKPRIVGRGGARADDEFERLALVYQRPGVNQTCAPLSSRSLSRSQLLVRRKGDLLEIRNVGRCALFVNGEAVEEVSVRSGDVLELGSQLVLLCRERTRQFPRLPEGSPPVAAFGDPDAQGFVGESEAAWRLRSDVAFVAPQAGHVLLLGATGAGKELAAQALHKLSKRAGPLVARNAATLPESLVDAELFGNLKGYPNPGTPEREGLIGAANGGTLFLDEFADLRQDAQAHLLRVLDAGEYQRLGESRARYSNFRLIAATNLPESALRVDVLARFDFKLQLPSLAERREDVPLIARHLLRIIASSDRAIEKRFFSDGEPMLSGAFVRHLVNHYYRANVRELRQILWRAVRESAEGILEWPGPSPTARSERTHAESSASAGAIGSSELRTALEANNGSIEKTWRTLGLSSRFVLMRLLRKHGITITKQFRRH